MKHYSIRGSFIVGLLVLAASVLSPDRALAWGQGGHRVVANIAYEQLTPTERKKVVKILRRHEDFEQRFADRMNDEIPNATAEDEDRWIFLQAAIWPDLIRGIPKYHRETWHFINFPYYLSDADRNALKNSNPNLELELPSPLTESVKQNLNCVQAFKLCIRGLSDSHTPVKEQAIYYCWLLHIAGDTHQPLHSTSLRSRTRFSQPEGDRGGHLPIVEINGAKNLHSYWDGLHGEQQLLKDIKDRTSDILTVEMKKTAEGAKKSLKAELWIDESHKSAKEFAYSEKILAAVTAGEDSPNNLVPVDLSAEYQKQAKRIADQRVAEAGYRLAEILRQLD